MSPETREIVETQVRAFAEGLEKDIWCKIHSRI